MRGAVAILIVAGCYDPAVSIGLPCADGDVCPNGQECRAGVCLPIGTPDAPDTTGADGPGMPDAVRIDARPIDTDGDGVFDDDDNCAGDPNADQHDEDHDGHGDVCDLCPHVFETMVQDADGDHVGDLCDPNTGVQNQIVFFDPFTSDRPEWTLTGPWSRANDMLSIDADQDSLVLAVPIGQSVLELGGRITSVGPVNRQITMTLSNSGTLSYYCEIFDNGTPRFNLSENDNGTYTTVDTALLPGVVASGFRFSAQVDAESDIGKCLLAGYAGIDYPLQGVGTMVPTPETHINVQHLKVELDYAIQIDTVP